MGSSWQYFCKFHRFNISTYNGVAEYLHIRFHKGSGKLLRQMLWIHIFMEFYRKLSAIASNSYCKAPGLYFILPPVFQIDLQPVFQLADFLFI